MFCLNITKKKLSFNKALEYAEYAFFGVKLNK